jgi:hypothetical protein
MDKRWSDRETSLWASLKAVDGSERPGFDILGQWKQRSTAVATWKRRPWLIGLSMGSAYLVLNAVKQSYSLGGLNGIQTTEIIVGLVLLLLAYRIERRI